MTAPSGWEPASRPPVGRLSAQMGELLDGHQSEYEEDDLLGPRDIPWLEGVRDAARFVAGDDLYRDACELIDAIREHQRVRLVAGRTDEPPGTTAAAQ